MADRAHVKLVTIIAASHAQDRLHRMLADLGVRHFTVSRVDGRGNHGAQERGFFGSGNVRLETIVGAPLADAILDRAAIEAESAELVAFSQDVVAIPHAHFAHTA
jgi:nitrogen regulatory protein PII